MKSSQMLAPGARWLVTAGVVGVLVVLLITGAIVAWIWSNSSGGTLSLAHPFSLWLLVPLVLAAFVLSAMLYRDQRRIASFGWVLILMLLRLGLILMLAILLLQPVVTFQWKHQSAGTVWVILDQSPSMQTVDGQASNAEKLHWAEGMGLLSRSTRPDEMLTEIGVLADELDGITPDPSSGAAANEGQMIAATGDRMDAWIGRLKTLLTKVTDARNELNGYRPGAGTTAVSNLTDALNLAQRNVANVRHAPTVTEARTALGTVAIGQWLGRANEALKQALPAADSAAVSRFEGGADWQSAMTKLNTVNRADLATALLTDGKSPGSKPLHDLAKQYTMRLGSFADKAQSSGSVEEKSLNDAIRFAFIPAGNSTNAASALQYAAEQIPAEEPASVILITDGRNNSGSDPTSPARALASRGVHVYGVLIGSHELSPDAAVEPVDFPDWVFEGDSIQPRAVVRLDGLQGQRATVELRRGGQLLETRVVTANKAHDMVPFDFVDKPPTSDKVIEYQLKVSQMPGEVNTQNNVANFRVAVKKDKLYALIVEDRPRWEYRYLSTYLSRRPGMKLQTVLLQPATVMGVAAAPPAVASPDNPRTEATTLPNTLADWEKYDVIVLGDIGPDVLTPQMQQFIGATVREKGAALIAIAGQRSMPEKFVGSALADVLPVTFNPQYSPDALERHLRGGFVPQSAPLAGMSVLAQLGADPSSNAKAWSAMPPWYWHSPYTQAKPSAVVTWSIGESGAAGGGGGGGPAGGTAAEANQHALMVTMSMGLGHVMYLSSDQTWRLRQVGGLNLHERFWGQVVNWAVGSDLPAGGKFVRFGADAQAYDQSQPVVVTAHVLRDDLTPYTGLSFSAVAKSLKGANGDTTPGNSVEARFEPMDSLGYYKATIMGAPIGDDEITLKGPEVERLLNSDPTASIKSVLIKVMPSMNAERRNMNTDPETLEAIARAGGGFSVDGQYAGMLFSRIPKLQHTETTTTQMGFFADPKAPGTQAAHWIFLALFAAVITLEWALRKVAGLV